MPTVALTDAQGELGRRVRDLFATDLDQIDAADPLEIRPVNGLLTRDLSGSVEGADVMVHLASGTPSSPTGATVDVQVARRVLDAAARTNVRHMVLLSDATVYGAWANNPVPLTDSAVLRPNPGFTFAAERAELERLAGEWRAAHRGATLTILRPVRTPGRVDWLLDALRPGRAVPDHTDEPPAQFLDLDDLASAVAVACRDRLDGAYNVAPDGAIPGEEVRSLLGTVARVRLPERVAERVASWRFRSGLGSTPPELVPYTLHSWVVASDRLRAAGWRPSHTNEEVCVSAHEAGPLDSLSPQRKQELALGIAGAGLVAASVGGALLLRRALRSR
jgi:nucleoside-diphosphate-sugar epimerase